MVDNDEEHLSYAAHLQRKIGRKVNKILRQSLQMGQQQAESMCNDFVGKLRIGMKKINQAKIDCAINRAGQLIAEHLAEEPQAVVSMMQKLFKNIAEHTDVEITAHPIDAAIIKRALSEGAYSSTASRKVALLEDEGFERGSLIIKANKSIIDAHVRTQLQRAKMLLINRIENKNGQAH